MENVITFFKSPKMFLFVGGLLSFSVISLISYLFVEIPYDFKSVFLYALYALLFYGINFFCVGISFSVFFFFNHRKNVLHALNISNALNNFYDKNVQIRDRFIEILLSLLFGSLFLLLITNFQSYPFLSWVFSVIIYFLYSVIIPIVLFYFILKSYDNSP